MLSFLLSVATAVTTEESSLFSADQFGGYFSTFVLTIINLLVAFFVIKRFIFKPILNIMKSREEKIKESIEQADKLKEEALANEILSKKTIDDARIEASTIIDKAKKTASTQEDIILKKTNDKASEIISHAEADAERIKKVALEEMKDKISDLAIVVASRIIGDMVDNATLKELSDKYTDEVVEEEVGKLGY